MIENIHFKNIGYQASKVPKNIQQKIKEGSLVDLEQHLLNTCVPIFCQAFEWNTDRKFYVTDIILNSDLEYTSGKLSFLYWVDVNQGNTFSWIVYNVLGEKNHKQLLVDKLWEGTLFLFPSNLQYRLVSLNMNIIKGSIDYDNID